MRLRPPSVDVSDAQLCPRLRLSRLLVLLMPRSPRVSAFRRHRSTSSCASLKLRATARGAHARRRRSARRSSTRGASRTPPRAKRGKRQQAGPPPDSRPQVIGLSRRRGAQTHAAPPRLRLSLDCLRFAIGCSVLASLHLSFFRRSRRRSASHGVARRRAAYAQSAMPGTCKQAAPARSRRHRESRRDGKCITLYISSVPCRYSE
jgi:hypothetical protein